MPQDATGMWETPPVPASGTAGSVGPGEMPQARPAPPAAASWPAAAGGSGIRPPELATGHVLDGVA